MEARNFVNRAQDRILRSFGGSQSGRTKLVVEMLAAKRGEQAGYWLQLVIATMLATLGLALDSVAVVIGAMLIAPLMKPLVAMAMGLATGSAALTFRATLRTVASVVLVVIVATAITWLLPFHDITQQLESRTTPNLLDLAIAGACALAAAYATIRSDADIATTAAGTSVGISLVPPLCACGYGLALGNYAVARGAALLFTANLSGILVLATLVFVAVGYSQISVRTAAPVDEGEPPHGRAFRAGRAWSKFLASRLGPVARIVPPLILLALVFVPLLHAVREIQHRAGIERAMNRMLGGSNQRVVQYTLHQTTDGVAIKVIVLGDTRDAAMLETAVRFRLLGLAELAPQLSVWAVPDAKSVSALAQRFDDFTPPPAPVPQTASQSATELKNTVEAAWPSSGTGVVVDVALAPGRVRVTHLGAPIGVVGTQLLARVLEPTVGRVEVSEDALEPVTADPGDAETWLPRAVDFVARARVVRGLELCVTRPDEPDSAATRWLATTSGISQVPGNQWRIEACPADR